MTAPLRWTRVPPSVEGFYLVKHPNGELDVCAVRLTQRRFDCEVLESKTLYVWPAIYHGSFILDETGSKAFVGYEWAGPVDPPSESI